MHPLCWYCFCLFVGFHIFIGAVGIVLRVRDFIRIRDFICHTPGPLSAPRVMGGRLDLQTCEVELK